MWRVTLLRLFTFVILGLVLLATPGRSSDSDFLIAEKLYRAREFSQAERLYAQVEPGDTNYPVAQLRLGTIYYLTGRPEQAENHFSIFLRFKKSPEVYCLLAGAQFNQGKFDLATNSAQQALELDPKFANAYTVLGMIYTAEKDFSHAEAEYRVALKIDDNDSDTWFMYGRALFLHDDFAEAAKAFDRALKINPQSVRSYENLARTEDTMADVKGAEETFKKGLNLNRTQKFFDPHIYVAYGEFLLKLNRLADSQGVLEEGSRVAPRDAEIRYDLSRVYFRMKHLQEAAQEAETALQLGGPDYKIDFLLAQIYTAMGNPQEAAKHAARAAEATPKP
jgi:tetratricopeptide (TPR) repeat protein